MESLVPTALAGERVDRAVALLSGRSRREVTDLVATGRVLLDGLPVAGGATRVRAGQRLAFDFPAPVDIFVEPDPSVRFGVVAEDDQVVVVDKPAGLVVHAGAGAAGPTLVGGLLHRYPDVVGVGDDRARPGIVHRLDAGTSGLMVVARTPGAFRDLVEQLRRREVTREYSVLVWGNPHADRGVIDAPIARSPRDRTRFAVVRDGRPARTHFEVERRYESPAQVAALACRLETGRTHQIRVHLSSIGHPVVGDDRYGGRRPNLELDRPFLHARRLCFRHPGSGEVVEHHSPLPPELAELLARLE
jgi:23S rRNA pseudouridine1911/1915/1917 synthase